MITNKQELLQAMIEAYIMEKATNVFYEESVPKLKNESAVEVFKELAMWEHLHMDYIGFLYKAILDDRDMVSFEDFEKKVVGEELEGGISVEKMEEKLERRAFMDDEGAIVIALEIEGHAYNMYRRLSEEAADTNTKSFMKDMMQWELKHIEYLKGLKAKIA